MNEWDPRENPLVERAFRTGFRRGAGSFRIGWYIAGLGSATIVPFLPFLFVPAWTMRDAASWMLPMLLGLLALIFVIGGFQRMLTSFSQERERGTFDFLHLSTLRSGAIVFGFLLSGQLPGYLALVLISPLIVLSAHFSGFPLSTLAALLTSLVFTVLALSILFLFAGFWSKKASEYRGASFFYAVLLCFGGWAVAKGFVWAGILPADVPQLLVGVPVLLALYGFGGEYAAAAAAGIDPPRGIPTLSFFGVGLPPWLLAIVILLPAVTILCLALSRSLRHRDRVPWSTAHATVLFAWWALCLVGVWGGSEIPHRMRCISLAWVAWIVMRRHVGRSTPTRARTIHALGRSKGGMRSLILGEEGPPLRLALVLFAVWWGACLLLAAEAWFNSGKVEALASSGPLLLWALAPALFLLPLATIGLLGQWLAWRAPSLRWGVIAVTIAFVILPYVVFAFGPTLAELPYLSSPLLFAYGALSPFSQLLSLARGTEPAVFSGAATLLGQLPYLLAFVVLVGLVRSSSREICERSRRLLAGLDGTTEKPAASPGSPSTP